MSDASILPVDSPSSRSSSPHSIILETQPSTSKASIDRRRSQRRRTVSSNSKGRKCLISALISSMYSRLCEALRYPRPFYTRTVVRIYAFRETSPILVIQQLIRRHRRHLPMILSSKQQRRTRNHPFGLSQIDNLNGTNWGYLFTWPQTILKIEYCHSRHCRVLLERRNSSRR